MVVQGRGGGPDFDRLLAALTRGGEPDRAPIAELMIDGEVMGAFLGRSVTTPRDVIEFQCAAGYDHANAWPHYNWNPAGIVPKEGVRRSSGRFSSFSDDEVEINWLPEGKGIITTRDDFAAYPFAPVDSIDFSMFDAYHSLAPAGMKLIACHGDIFRRVTELMGYETFCYALHEDPELVEMMFQKVGSIIYALFERAVEKPGVGAMWYCDDIAYSTGLLASPQALRRYAFPWYRKLARLAHDHGLPIIYHSDGVLWEVMDDLTLDIGFDALHPIEPKAMDIVEVKRRVGDRVCVIGNIDVDLLARGAPEEVAALTHKRIEELAPGGGYVLGSSNTVPRYCRAENFRAMVEVATSCRTRTSF